MLLHFWYHINLLWGGCKILCRVSILSWLHYPDGKNETKCKQHLQVDHQTLQVLQFLIIPTLDFADKGVFQIKTTG